VNDPLNAPKRCTCPERLAEVAQHDAHELEGVELRLRTTNALLELAYKSQGMFDAEIGHGPEMKELLRRMMVFRQSLARSYAELSKQAREVVDFAEQLRAKQALERAGAPE
jgi:hypothetical protein